MGQLETPMIRDRLTVTGHALERMEERWPKLVEGMTDKEMARLIQGEVNDALIAGRSGVYCPIELASADVERWRARTDGYYVWTKDKMRGYALTESNTEGIVVLTVLVGQPHEIAKRKLRRHG
jgi:hypothetical protein